ncbi:MAG: hypothetical protein CMH41_02740 [Micrococcales bacterium]|nr:hypothetical protein [Micrococcales bacterium]
MQIDDPCRREVLTRLQRVKGQVNGILNMIEEGRECSEVLTQLSAASHAIDRAGLRIISEGLNQHAIATAAGEEPPMTREELEKLFLSLA